MSGIYRVYTARRVAIMTAVIVSVLSGAQVFAQRGPSFQGLGALVAPDFIPETTANDISADGSVVVGYGLRFNQFQAFRWTQTSGFEVLPGVTGSIANIPRATSGDGSVVVGKSDLHSAGFRAFRWTSSTGSISLSSLPGGAVDSSAFAVSADGSVIVGDADSFFGNQAFRWTQSGGIVGLGFLPGLTVSSSARGISGDGTVIVGGSVGALGSGKGEPFRWTAETGMVSIGFSGGFSSGTASIVSADGLVVVGIGLNSSSVGEPFRWTEAEGMVGLGDLPGGQFRGNPLAISADGTLIVGSSFTSIGQEAFIWDAINGMRNLKDVLENEIGLDLNGWFLLGSADGISDDGRVITGTGSNLNSGSEAWIAILNECGKDADCSDGLFCNGVETCVANVCVPGVDVCPAGDPCIEASRLCASDIPTLSQWGLVAMTLLLLTAATFILRQRAVRER